MSRNLLYLQTYTKVEYYNMLCDDYFCKSPLKSTLKIKDDKFDKGYLVYSIKFEDDIADYYKYYNVKNNKHIKNSSLIKGIVGVPDAVKRANSQYFI